MQQNGNSGRDGGGRFSKGNSGGPGNPHAKRVGELRTAFLEAVTVEEMKAIVTMLLEQARAGDIHAAKEVLLRTLGRPTEADFAERLERIEAFLSDREAEVA